jgi:tetratricopeptide (TPR) repeat protein
LVLASAAAPRVRADEVSSEPDSATERARLHFKLGVDFYRERNYRAALIEFQRAYDASPHFKLLYNLGQASLELQEDTPAIEYFTRYLQEGAGELSDDRKRDVEQNLLRLRARLASLTIETNQEGAEIYVDETMVGSSPLAGTTTVSVGRRRISAVKHGFTDVERIIDIAAGDKLKVVLEFKERPQLDFAKLQLVAAGNRSQSDSSMSAAAWTGIATGMVGAGAITLTVLTALAQSAYDDEMKGQTSAARLRDVRDDAKAKALIADVLWGATVATGALTAILLFTDSGSERPPHAAVDLKLGPTSLRVDGRF